MKMLSFWTHTPLESHTSVRWKGWSSTPYVLNRLWLKVGMRWDMSEERVAVNNTKNKFALHSSWGRVISKHSKRGQCCREIWRLMVCFFNWRNFRQNLLHGEWKKMHRQPQQECLDVLTIRAVYARQGRYGVRPWRAEGSWDCFKHPQCQQPPKVPKLLGRQVWMDLLRGLHLLAEKQPSWNCLGASVIQRQVWAPFCFGHLRYKMVTYPEYSKLQNCL